MMKAKRVQEEIIGILEKHMGASRPNTIRPDQRLVQDLHLSLSEISLLLFEIEHHFNMIFPDELITGDAVTVRDLCDTVEME